MDAVTHTVELVVGHVEKTRQGDVRHTRVVFGHRITAKDLFALDEDPLAQNPTQYNDMVIRAHVTEFGTLKLPVSLSVLLNLDSVDREDLQDGCNIFQAMSAEGRSGEFLPDHKVKLGWGFKVNDVVYTHVQFGKRLTGMDDVEADRAGLKPGVRRLCFLVGRQITEIASDDDTAKIDGPISLDYFNSLDAADIATLRGAAELWRQSFRIAGANVSRNGTGKDSNSPGAEVRLERGADPQPAGGTSQ